MTRDVTVTTPTRETSINRVTDGIGRFSLPLPAGGYSVAFELPGFLTETRTDSSFHPRARSRSTSSCTSRRSSKR